MRGHTSNRILKACILSLIRLDKARMALGDYSGYFQGRIDVLEELAIFMDIELEVDSQPLGEENEGPDRTHSG